MFSGSVSNLHVKVPRVSDLRIFFGPQIFQSQKYGGISRYFVELAQSISTRELAEVGVCAAGSFNEYVTQLPRKIVHGMSVSGRLTNYRLRRAAEILQEEYLARAFRPDVIHETYYRQRFRGPRAPKRVVTVYDMIHERLAESFEPADRTAALKACAVRQADHVICISESTRRDLIEFLNVPPEKITVIYLASSMPIVANEEGRSHHPLSQRPYLLYVGARSGYKNFWRFAEAVAISAALAEFDVICFGGGGLTVTERERLSALGFDGQRLRQMSGDDTLLAQCYQGASCFVYPSLYEGFGIPPLEAMANGCPVVCSDTSSIPEVVADAGEYFDPQDTEAVAHAIECVALSRERTGELIEKGFVRAKAFSWDQCADLTLEVYRSLLNKRGGA